METLNTWSETFLTAGLSHFVQVAIFAGLLAGVDLAFGRRLGAHWRCALWLLFFVKLLLPPQIALPTSPAYWWSRADPAPTPALAPFLPMRSASPGDNPWSDDTTSAASAITTPSRVHSGATPHWHLIIAAGYGVMVIALGTMAVLRHDRLARVLRCSEPASAALTQAMERARAQVGLRTCVTLRVNPAPISPIVVGLWRPVVHLPRALAERLAPKELHTVLVHELHHVQRGDLWVVALQTIARVLFFHHPAVWWVNAHLARLREVATDRAVLSHPDIDGRSYSIALVEAATLMARTAPGSHFALGVIETKSQLKKRITMNLHQSRPGRVRLGVPGLLSLAALALVLVPMMPAQADNVARSVPTGFKSVEAAALTRRIDEATTAIIDAFNRRDREAYLAAFSAAPLLLPNGGGLISSRSGIAEMYLRAPSGLLYEPMRWADRQFYHIGPWIIETGLVGFEFRLTPEGPILNDPRQPLTIWEEAADGSLRVKLLSWNGLVAPDELQRSSSPAAFVCTRAEGDFTTEGEPAAVLQAEERFHQAIEAKRMSEAAQFYADGASLIVPEALPIHGQAAILRYLESIPPDRLVRKIERQVAHVEGSGNHVLVVNLFQWHFQPAGADVKIPIAGKGVHLWQRNESGAWRILFDLCNVSQSSM
jgi:beta-lactamase regulating signal transducer with metallopeptidase domain/ketosteroid isomerase-like protein